MARSSPTYLHTHIAYTDTAQRTLFLRVHSAHAPPKLTRSFSPQLRDAAWMGDKEKLKETLANRADVESVNEVSRVDIGYQSRAGG